MHGGEETNIDRETIRIEPEEPEIYTDSISGKWQTFPPQLLRSLVEKGKEDARRALKL